MAELFVGLMSGTSLDGVDAVLVESITAAGAAVADRNELADPADPDGSADPAEGRAGLRIVHAVALPYPAELKALVLAVCRDQAAPFSTLGRIDVLLARWYSTAVQTLLQQAGVAPTAVRAIGSHGQTVHHEPTGDTPFTLQLGDPNLLAASTGITVVADFRRRDMALGGQGAPLAPGFHDVVFRHPTRCRVVLNCGGIANISVLAPGQACIGYDTGPANILMDAWVQARRGLPYDKDGQWALQGQLIEPLLTDMLRDPYFARPAPKSTGREHFNLGWIQTQLAAFATSPAGAATAGMGDHDVQRTLLELSARSVADAIAKHAEEGDLLVAGGGAYNLAMLERLRAGCPRWAVRTTAALGMPPEHVEAAAFAVFAQRTMDGLTGNLPTVTGASRLCVLGGIYPP
jgi:anhydro-N-acetylmuramic acid kinase